MHLFWRSLPSTGWVFGRSVCGWAGAVTNGKAQVPSNASCGALIRYRVALRLWPRGTAADLELIHQTRPGMVTGPCLQAGLA
jgi:hypothetical protein